MAKVLISIRGGNIEEIISTDSNIQFVIVDHDNVNVEPKSLETDLSFYHPDRYMCEDELLKHIEKIKQDYL
jgi:hypothetical protein